MKILLVMTTTILLAAIFFSIATANSLEYDIVSIFSFQVPEPATLLLLGIGLIGLSGTFRKSLKKK